MNKPRRKTPMAGRAAPRRGISIIEVLMSIAVVAIGLIGVLSLVPVGAHQAQAGAVQDRVVQIAEQAYDELMMLHLPWDHAKFVATAPPTPIPQTRWFFPQDDRLARFRWLATREDPTVAYDDPLTTENPDIPAENNYPANTYRIRVDVFYGYKTLKDDGVTQRDQWNPASPEVNKHNRPQGTYRRALRLGVASAMSR